jgi:hypothetical protein
VTQRQRVRAIRARHKRSYAAGRGPMGIASPVRSRAANSACALLPIVWLIRDDQTAQRSEMS